MAEFFDYNGNRFELPKLTLSLKEELEAAVKAPNDTRAGIEEKYNFVKNVMPSDYLEDLLEGSTVGEIDVQALLVMLNDIDSAYNLPIIQGRLDQVAKMMEPLEKVAGNIEVLTAMTNGNRAMRRAGFKSVK